MNYNFFSSLLIRTPLYSIQDLKELNYSDLLKNNDFKTAIFLASKSFSDELEKKQFDFELLTEKQKHTVRKYINRAAFRSTPFGLFSTFSLVKWLDQPESKVILLSKITPFIKLDFSVLVKLWGKYLQDQNVELVKFQPNQSLYFNDTDFRYIKTDIDESDQTHFSMVSVAKNPKLKKLLKFCASGKSLEEIRLFILKETGVGAEIADQFIRELFDQQIIVSNNEPNITGEDYSDFFSRYVTDDHPCKEVRVLGRSLRALSENSSGDLSEISKITEQLLQCLLFNNEKDFFYSVAERSPLHGGLPIKYQEQIKEGLHCLNVLQTPTAIDDLKKFKVDFKAKYESQEVPLLHVLDSQFGIGYGEFANIKNSYSFLNTSSKGFEKKYLEGNIEGKDLASLLLNEWHFANNFNEYEIEITDSHLKNVKVENKSGKLPPSISVVFRILGENIFIENAGGCSALSLLGRFSCSKDVYRFGREIARQEQCLNKNVVFAEIAHVCNLHSANISRRSHLRDFEIPVLTNSIIDQDKQIHLNDIMVSVIDDTVVLRSKRLRKNIIPKLSSAFNYTKSCFPIFRFLCDVQRQHLMADFSFSLSTLIPGLKFYPRVRYKSCILQMAEWHFTATELNFLLHRKIYEGIKLFEDFAKAKNLPRYFAYTVYDNFLVFDLENKDDIALFLKEIKNKDVVILKEFPFVDDKKSLIEDDSHHPLIAQCVASLYLAEEVYKKGKAIRNETNFSRETKSTSDWLYFKIYCHPLSSDNILCDYIIPLIKKQIKGGLIEGWFWVRYQDPEYHIRLRIKSCKNKRSNLFDVFNVCLNKLCAVQLVHRFHADIYRQETKRYSVKLIRFVEAVFNSSSHIIGNFLKTKHSLQWSDEKVLLEAVLAVYEMLVFFNIKHLDQRANFCKIQFDQFFDEFSRPKALKPEIEKLHKTLHSEIISRRRDKGCKRIYRLLKNDIAHLLQNFRDKKVKAVTIEKLAADIIHMHINRLFSYNQRYFEMVIYYLLYRSLTTEFHKAHSTCS